MIKIHYTIKDFPLEERPREKVKQYGINNVTNKELLSIILKTGTKNINVEDLALSILRKYKLHELKDVTINELTKIKGIGEVKAIELLAAIELGKRINYKTEEKKKKLNDQLKNDEDDTWIKKQQDEIEKEIKIAEAKLEFYKNQGVV